MAIAPFTAAKIARDALKHWQSMPEDEKRQHVESANRVKALLRELTGIDGGGGRDKGVVARELNQAVAPLSGAAAKETGAIAADRSRAIRMGRSALKRRRHRG